MTWKTWSDKGNRNLTTNIEKPSSSCLSWSAKKCVLDFQRKLNNHLKGVKPNVLISLNLRSIIKHKYKLKSVFDIKPLSVTFLGAAQHFFGLLRLGQKIQITGERKPRSQQWTFAYYVRDKKLQALGEH